MKITTRFRLWLTGRRIRKLKLRAPGAYLIDAHVITGGKPLTDEELRKLSE